MHRVVVSHGIICDPDREPALIGVDRRRSHTGAEMDARQNQGIDVEPPEMSFQIGIGKRAEKLLVGDEFMLSWL
jgi:hypothetical protein